MMALQFRPLTGRTVLIALLAFFGVVAAVNVVFLVVALSTHPGIETEDAYRRGIAYNDALRAAEQQAAIGWRARIDFDPAEKFLGVEVSDRHGDPISGLVVSGRAIRTVTAGHDFEIAFSEERPGNYRAAFAPALSGQWLVRIEARDRRGRVFRQEKRVWSK